MSASLPQPTTGASRRAASAKLLQILITSIKSSQKDLIFSKILGSAESQRGARRRDFRRNARKKAHRACL